MAPMLKMLRHTVHRDLLADGRIKPTITAPGSSIISADSDGIKSSSNSGTITMSGTSMATPTAAGAAALIRQYYTDGFYPYGEADAANAFTPSAALVKATLINSAQQHDQETSLTGRFPPPVKGWGRIDLANPLAFAGDSKDLVVRDGSAELTTAANWSETFYVTGGQPVKVTLVWTDYPGTVGSKQSDRQ